MANIYYKLILAGRKTIDDVPEVHKEEVEKLLNGGE
ncbi:MAG: CD1375 family protein [Lachnospirales bacterium]